MKTASAMAITTNHLAVELMERDGVGFAVADLHGETHYDLWRMYERLPAVIAVDGHLYGKSGWDSDREKAYYRTDRTFATPA